VAGFLNGKIGLGSSPSWVLGPMHVARAQVALEYDYEEMDWVEVDGWTFCLTEVIAWPFAEDEEGVPFDQANLYGVRTRTWRRPLADGGGDSDDYWTAVPKTLPVGYTRVNRGEGILPDGFYADYLGSDLMGPKSWNLRTPTGLLLNATTDPDGLRAQWAPMNQSQRVSSVVIGDAFSGQWVEYVPEEFYTGSDRYWVALISDNHIGFRNCKLTWTFGTSFIPSSGTFEIIAVRADEYWDPIDADNPPPSLEVLASGTVVLSSGDTLPKVMEFDLGPLIPASIGIPFKFFIRYHEEDGAYPGIYGSHSLILSPRTDVPLWYSASMGNRVAPGGYVAPP
jgi:hypothetical protein